LDFKRFYKKIRGQKPVDNDAEAQIISRSGHDLSREQISENALKVLYRLKKSGFDAFLVGGGVRDALLNMPSKDFDIATDATPEEIRGLFKNSRIIGRRFRLVHIVFRGEVIEVSTFRSGQPDTTDPFQMVKSDNTFGAIEEDVWRRDFTVNALYYNIKNFSIVDYTGGLHDLKKRVLRLIGDPVQRAHEDPVRLLRALRFKAKLNMTLEKNTEKVVRKYSQLIENVSQSRLIHEFEKLFCSGYAFQTFQQLVEYDYLKYFFSSDNPCVRADEDSPYDQMLISALKSSDQRFWENKSLNPGFILGVFLWPQQQEYFKWARQEGLKFNQSVHESILKVLKQQQQFLNVSKRLAAMIKSMWLLQYHMERRRPKRVLSLLRNRYYRAAYDLLLLRGETNPKLQSLAHWWNQLYEADEEQRISMVEAFKEAKRKS
jgi:poly(A) polymerase